MRALLFATLAVASSCAADLTVQGRPVDVTVPQGSSAQTPMPLLILAHGYGVNGHVQNLVFPFSQQIDARQFRYALPHGTQDANGKRFWNATNACCDFGPLNVDDVGYFRAIVERAKSEFAVTKVFLVGHSNGAFMSLRLACEAGDVFDGIVAVSGSTWNDATRCPDGRAVPILLVHGTADDTIPYEGQEGLYPSARATAERFARRAGCSPSWSTLGRSDFIGDSAEETVRDSTGCATSAVDLWTIEDGPHALVFDAKWTGDVLTWLEEKAK